ncbi:MAG: ABC-F family ATP-binding cassette domain-containing protein [Bacteroidales bacterium]|nr:ABC-F family ATP-binding cassette domain-containing protein [Bacteroidales bacterium]
MPSFLQVERLSKSYGPKVLFENISFNVNEGDKIALVAPNGTGKTSLLRILAGADKSDTGGSIRFLKDIRTAFLEQEYQYNPSNTIAQQVFDGDFEHELALRRILTELGLDPSRTMSSLSGGEVKRVAIAELLSTGAEFLIMDEPTNHLDVDGIEYLEGWLKKSRRTLFMVTHDRYFLDRVCNTVMEMDRGAIYIYRGDYENFLSKRDERISNYNAQTDKVRNILRRELEWIHATPCARGGKAKYRKQAFLELKDRAENSYTIKTVAMDELSTGSRLGNKVIDCNDLCWNYRADGCDIPLISHFSYKFQRYERVGIVGANGVGKSTFLNLLVEGNLPSIQRGESLKIGYYRQQGMNFREDDTVLDIVPDTHLLGQFLFPHEMFSNRISRLSGGEKRRLYLLTVLMQNPNLLILDEPTNDLDIVTLNILEEYLIEFKGSLIIVTHDRHFLDRLVDHLLVFCGNGVIKDFIGAYSEYRSYMEDMKAARKKEDEKEKIVRAPVERVKKKLSFKEKREFDALEIKIASLEKEKSGIEAFLSSGTGSYEEISSKSERYRELGVELDEAELRWLELSELDS